MRLNNRWDTQKEFSEAFHGRRVKGAVNTETTVYTPTDYALLGILTGFELEGLGEGLEILFGGENTDLAELDPENSPLLVVDGDNPHQLYVVGFPPNVFELMLDSIEEMFELNQHKPKTNLGNLIAISYYTDKHHLTGPKSQENGAEYRHEFGRDPEGDVPELIIDTREQTLYIIGGDYIVTDLGIKG
jgi:hypothetical protein